MTSRAWSLLALTLLLCACKHPTPGDTPVSYPASSDAGLQMPAPRSLEPVNMVFLGDSITYAWDVATLQPGAINKGIPGNSSCDMLARFNTDVVALNPDALHLLVGANDVASSTPDFTCLDALINLCLQQGIPFYMGYMTPGVDRPEAGVIAWNARIDYWKATYPDLPFTIIDYYTAMRSTATYFQSSLYLDTVHPNAQGYAVMSRAYMLATGGEPL